jgi:hypothetical protein
MRAQSWIVTVLVVTGGVRYAQGQGPQLVNLTQQGKLGSGTTLPASCKTGQVFFKSDAPSGANVYACTAQNAWTVQGVPSAGSGIVVSGNAIAVEDAVVPMYYTGTGAPTIACVTGRDFYVDTAAGSVYFCKAAGQWQAAFDPNDPSNFWLVEEFPSGKVDEAYIGTNGWFVNNIAGGCTLVYERGLANRPGVMDLQASGANGGCSVSLDGLLPSPASTVWKAKWSWSATSAATTSNFAIRIGVGNGANTNAVPTDGLWVKLLQGTDTRWQYELYSGGSLVGSVDSGVAFGADNLYTAQLRGDGTKWYVALSTNGGAYSTEKSVCSSGCDLAGALPTIAVGPFASILHGAAVDGATKKLYVDRFSVQITGVVR